MKITIDSLEKGEESILLKICTGCATVEEKEKWLHEQNLDSSISHELLNVLIASFNVGSKMAEEIEKVLFEQGNFIHDVPKINQENDGKISSKLGHIDKEIESLKEQLESMLGKN